jgi:hypothetical protein
LILKISIINNVTVCVLLEINGFYLLSDPVDKAGYLYQLCFGSFSSYTNTPAVPMRV